MPNNSAYADSYLLAGNVTFSASNTLVYASSTMSVSTKGNFSFVPSFVMTEKNDNILPINVNEAFDGYPEGSSFFRDLNRAVRPFEAYILAQTGNANRFSIAEETTGITEFNDNGVKTLRIYNLEGQLIYSGPGIKHWGKQLNLKPGVYIVNGRKELNR